MDRSAANQPHHPYKNAISRKEAARDLGVTVQTVASYARKGILREFRVNGVPRYHRADVAGLVARKQRELGDESDGAIAAKVFAAFKAGKTHTDIVIDFKLEPTRVRLLYAEYRAGFQPLIVPTPRESRTRVRAAATAPPEPSTFTRPLAEIDAEIERQVAEDEERRAKDAERERAAAE